jgi:hypothetical protein
MELNRNDFKKVHRFFLKAKKDSSSGGVDTIKAIDEILEKDKQSGQVRIHFVEYVFL